jgi:hypothetical protein
VAEEAGSTRVVEATVAAFGRLDILANKAGTSDSATNVTGAELYVDGGYLAM